MSEPSRPGEATSISQPQFENVDDYKNWQMANLNSLVFMDEILNETLSQLQATDEFWYGITRTSCANHSMFTGEMPENGGW